MAVEVKQRSSALQEKPRALDIVYQRMHRRRMQASEKQSHPDREKTDERTDDGYALYIRDASHALLSFDQEQLIYAARDSSDQSLFEIPCNEFQEKGVYERIRDGFVKDDDREQFAEIVASSENAGQVMMRYNLRLVIARAKKYRGISLPFDDLIQEGNIGLMKAVERFDPDRGKNFSTYATEWIRASIGRAMHTEGPIIRLPDYMQGHFYNARKYAARFELEYQRRPSDAEMRSFLTGRGVLNESQNILVKDLLNKKMEPLSLDYKIKLDRDETLGDFIADPKDEYEETATAIYDREVADALMNALRHLSTRERGIVSDCYGLNGHEPLSRSEIADKYGITRERVRVIHHNALKVLRSPTVANKLSEVLHVDPSAQAQERNAM